jgi:membrane-associated phospholipid phosphatase
MKTFFYRIFQNIAALYTWENLAYQLLFILITLVFVISGVDWKIYTASRGAVIQSLAFPAVWLGLLIPIAVPCITLIYGILTKNFKAMNVTYALAQSAFLGFCISSFYKVFTGRSGPPHGLALHDTSTMFHLGFYRAGAFQGWPSSHTTVAFAVSFAVITMFPKNKLVKIIAFVYALYIGLGISITIHWFSDFIAGAILGTIIGISVGTAFLQRGKQIVSE